MQSSVTSQINALRRMTVRELKAKWRELYGQDSRSNNRVFLWRRLAWRIQELHHGGLSQRAKDRIAELNQDDDLRMLPPRKWQPPINSNGDHLEPQATRQPLRDPRLPRPGSMLTRRYRGEEVRVLVREDGYEWAGKHFRSLSAVACAVTGAKWSGLLFFKLRSRTRKR